MRNLNPSVQGRPRCFAVSAPMRITRICAFGLLLLASLSAPLSAAAEVFLATTISNVSYEPDSFGRRLTFQTGYFTGGDDGPPCTDVALDNVVLVLDLPPDTTLVSESEGTGVYDAVAGTVTWQFGTVQPPCVFNLFNVTFDVDPSVPDGTSLDATASISTTTAGDDPSDNQATRSFVIGFLPLEVSLTFAEGECQTISTTDTVPNARVMGCGPGGGGGSAYFFPPPYVLGYIADITDVVRTSRAAVSASNRLNNDDVSGTVAADVYVINPNPYEVRLHAHRDTHTSCWVHNGTAETYIEDSQAEFAECGFGNIDWMWEHSLSVFNADGDAGGVCTVTVNGFSIERGSLNFTGSTPSCLSQSVGPNGQRLFRLDSFAGSATQSGHGMVATSWAIGLAGSGIGFHFVVFRIAGGSPVLLRLRDAGGFEVGAVDEGAGPISRIDLPGSFYNGVQADPQEIQLALPDAGPYVLEVLGTAEGPYSIALQATGHAGALIGEQVLMGQASVDSLDSYVVTLHEDGTFEVPEPASAWMLGAGVALLLALKKRRAQPCQGH